MEFTTSDTVAAFAAEVRQFLADHLTIEAQEIVVHYWSHYFVAADYARFEFRSPQEPPRRIPLSETGYRSHFAATEEVAASSSPQEYARDFVLSQIRSYSNAKTDRNQLPLF